MVINELTGIQVIGPEIRCDTLTSQKAEIYHTATITTIPQLQYFADRFEDALLTVYNGRKFPPYAQEIVQHGNGGLEFKIGGVAFNIKQPAASPSYADMVRNFLKYAEFMLGEWGRGERIPGVIAIENDVYMALYAAKSKLREYQYLSTGTKKPEIKFSYKNSRLLDIVKVLSFKDDEPSELTPRSARKYTIAKKQLKLHERNIVSQFRDAVKDHIDFALEESPVDIAVWEKFTLGRFLVLDLISPKETTRYKEVYEGLQEYLLTGEATALALGHGNKLFRIRDGEVYASIPCIALEVMELLSDPEITSKSVQHRIQLVPKTRHDAVVFANIA